MEAVAEVNVMAVAVSTVAVTSLVLRLVIAPSMAALLVMIIPLVRGLVTVTHRVIWPEAVAVVRSPILQERVLLPMVGMREALT